MANFQYPATVAHGTNSAATAELPPLARMRIMRELQDIHNSDSCQAGIFSVELRNDAINHWFVNLYQFDKASALQQDLQLWQSKGSRRGVRLHVSFPNEYPLRPPFVRVVEPQMSKGFVMRGGAICMQLLTDDGWSPAYSMEMMLLQIMATMVSGKARINFDSKTSSYHESDARMIFDLVSKYHAKEGWIPARRIIVPIKSKNKYLSMLVVGLIVMSGVFLALCFLW